jgi:hypothetical protein
VKHAAAVGAAVVAVAATQEVMLLAAAKDVADDDCWEDSLIRSPPPGNGLCPSICLSVWLGACLPGWRKEGRKERKNEERGSQEGCLSPPAMAMAITATIFLFPPRVEFFPKRIFSLFAFFRKPRARDLILTAHPVLLFRDSIQREPVASETC